MNLQFRVKNILGKSCIAGFWVIQNAAGGCFEPDLLWHYYKVDLVDYIFYKEVVLWVICLCGV